MKTGDPLSPRDTCSAVTGVAVLTALVHGGFLTAVPASRASCAQGQPGVATLQSLVLAWPSQVAGPTQSTPILPEATGAQ